MRKASASRFASLTTGVIAALLLSVFAFGGQAGAWVTPTLTANCAPDATHDAWTINLHPEADQKIEMSWGTGAFTAFQMTDFVTSGAHTFTTARGGSALTVRYASDRNVKTSATANGTVCGTTTGSTGGTVAGSQQGPSGNNGDVKIHDTATAVQDNRNEPHVCSFYIDGFKFDKASSGTWRIEKWAPSGSGIVASGTWGPADANGNWHSVSMTLADGHYKLFFKQTGTPGGEKQKVFWVDCGKTAGERSKDNEDHNRNNDNDNDNDSAGNENNGGTGGTKDTCTGVAKILSHSDIDFGQGRFATVSFTMGKGCTGQELSLVSYTASSDTFSRESASEQRIYQAKTGTFGDQTGAHTYVLQVNVPSCFFQVDFMTGKPIAQFGPADSDNFYSDQGRLLAGINGGTMSCNASNTTGGNETPQTVTPASAFVGSPADSTANGGTGSTGSTPNGNVVAGFETAPNAVGSVSPIVEVPGSSDQQSPNVAAAGVQAGTVAGVQSLPSTSTSTPAAPLAALGLAIMALGGVMLRRRGEQR